MKKPFSGNYKLTQAYNDPCCRDAYKKFGLLGHNGQDYGLPTGTKVLAPHSGKVIEAALDPQGYGLYLKIENDTEGSVLAHLKEFRVGVGDQVSEGQLVALSDNSGNSTGPHLHWGYYRIPRNRQNGFAGFIDQAPLLASSLYIPDALTECLSQHSQLVALSNLKDQTVKELSNEIDGFKSQIQHYTDYERQLAGTLNCQADEAVILGEITKLINDSDQLRDLLKRVPELDKEISDLTAQVSNLKTGLDNALIQNKTLADANTVSKRSILELEWQLKRTQQVYFPLFEFLGIVFCKKAR